MCPLLLLAACLVFSAEGQQAVDRQRVLNNIFTHPLGTPALDEVQQDGQPIRIREEVNTTTLTNVALEADANITDDLVGAAQNSTTIAPSVAPTLLNGTLTLTTVNETTTINSTLVPSDAVGNLNQTAAPTTINSTSPPATAGTSAPTTVNGTVPSTTTPIEPQGSKVMVVVNSSFIVSTPEADWTRQAQTKGPLLVIEQAPEDALDALTMAYAQLAASVVDETNAGLGNALSQAETVRMSLRQQNDAVRKLQIMERLIATVDYDPSTATLVGMKPAAQCPDAPPGTVCLITFGQYTLTVEEAEDSQVIYDIFVQETQAAIESGILQEQLDEADPDSIFSVEGASEPVAILALETGTAIAGSEPGESSQEDKDATEDDASGGLDGVMLGLIVAISVTAFIVCVLLAVFFYLKLSAPQDVDEKGTRHADYNKDTENPAVTPAPMESYPGDNEESGNANNLPSYDFPEDAQKREFRRRVDGLVREHCPEEIQNVDKMLLQFEGREKALIAMLENMESVEKELEEDHGGGYSDDGLWSEASDQQDVAAFLIDSGEEAKEEVQED